MSKPVFRIKPSFQNYDWGKIGLASRVAQLASAAGTPGFTLDDAKPYAELWMGTHPSSPSRVWVNPDTELGAHLTAHPRLLGTRVVERFAANAGNLPFLFKVLSIQKALSIQSHPDKRSAELLHAQQPHIYKDANHKPEMAIALTPFLALCGFLPLPQIYSYLRSTPEFATLIPEPIAADFASIAHDSNSPRSREVLKSLFSSLMNTDPSTVRKHLRALVSRYEKGDIHADERGISELVQRLDSQFPDDIGVFCVFLLNYVHLNPGEAIFLGAGEPHAYISGDIMECMANSDNVIRAGLTPKLRDVPNLVAGLAYTFGSPSQHFVQPVPFSPHPAEDSTSDSSNVPAARTVLYDPPVPEFSVLRVTLQPGELESHRAINGPSMAIVTEGQGIVRWADGGELNVSVGHVFFVGASTEVTFEALLVTRVPLTVYRAFVEVAEQS